MKAFIRKNKGIFVVDLKGEIDFASTQPFHQVCLENLSEKNIVFNLQELSFVGSDGLSSFMQTMKHLDTISSLKFCCVGSEFRRVFANHEKMKEMPIYDDEEEATNSFHQSNIKFE